MTELHDAWDELLEATPPGWYVGRPSHHDERNEWVMYAFDPAEKPVMGKRSREWTRSRCSGSLQTGPKCASVGLACA